MIWQKIRMKFKVLDFRKNVVYPSYKREIYYKTLALFDSSNLNTRLLTIIKVEIIGLLE